MKVRYLLLVGLVAAAVSLAGVAGSAEAAKPDRLLATPANACRALVEIRPDLYPDFGRCVGQLNRELREYRWPLDPNTSLSERCRQLEQGVFVPPLQQFVTVTYPFFFGEPAGWPFPEFTAQNHKQCQITLLAYHRFVGF